MTFNIVLMKKMFFLFPVFFLFACEKDISVTIPKPDENVVVEAYIENEQVPYVFLTINSPYFETVDVNSLGKLIVTNAFVTVSDGSEIDTLRFTFTPDKFPFAYYVGTKKAKIGRNYHLKVVYLRDTIIAETTIYEPVTIDSLVFKPEPQYLNDSLGYIWVYFQDNANTIDYYRVNSMILDEDSVFLHPYRSVLDDRLLNGRQFQFPTYHGITGMQGAGGDSTKIDMNDQTRFMFKAGQKVIVKISHIDVQTYQFWQSIEMQQNSAGNPFASPSTILSNVRNGLGIFGGYGAVIDTLELKMPGN